MESVGTGKIKLGVLVPTFGPAALEAGVGSRARAAELAGFDSLWVADHIVMPARSESRYPFSDDGEITWPMDQPFLDAMVACGAIAEATELAEIGTAVLVLSLRDTVTVAKQVATIDHISKGRFALGVGLGWLREEFEILGVDFDTRSSLTTEAITLLRSAWTGRPPEFEGKHHHLPDGVHFFPVPTRAVPILMGGTSDAALDRAASLADGWIGLQSASRIDCAQLEVQLARLTNALSRRPRESRSFRILLRVIQSKDSVDEVARNMDDLRELGVTEVIVDVDWDSPLTDVTSALRS